MCAFAALAVAIAMSSHFFDVDKVQNALVSIPVTVAIFAVNFSFLEYQFSAYRSVLRGLSISHIIAAAGILLLSIVPLAALYLGYSLRTASAVVIPIVTYTSVGLALLARRNADPLHQIDSATSQEMVWKFFQKYAVVATDHLASLEELELSKPKEMPLHEWDRRTPPFIQGEDPFAFAFQVASAAIASTDFRVFAKVLDRLLNISALSTMYRDDRGQNLIAGSCLCYLTMRILTYNK
jgi:hypothetical protein